MTEDDQKPARKNRSIKGKSTHGAGLALTHQDACNAIEVSEHLLDETLEAMDVDDATAQRIQKLPHDVGWLLITAGVMGLIVPGVIGTPFLALGGLMLWPRSSHRAERWLAGHSPKPFKGSMRQINRFLDDLERRYPMRKR